MTPEEFFGEDGEDFLLFSHFGPEGGGFYVDVGAFDGVHGSLSLVFERLGWQGLCVEAHPHYAGSLKTNRPGATCLHAAVTARPGRRTVTVHADPLGLATGTQRPAIGPLAARYGTYGRPLTRLPRVVVPALSLDELLERHTGGRRRIDLLALDTAGGEAAVLERLDPARHDVRVFVVRAETEAERTAVTAALTARGYTPSRRFPRRLVFANEPTGAMAMDFRRVDCTIANMPHPVAGAATPARLRGRVLRDGRFWLTDNVLCQQSQQPLSAILDYPPRPVAATPVRLVHAVNLYSRGGPGLDATQAATVASMAEAAAQGRGETLLLNVQSAGDPDLTPAGFERAPPLERDARALGDFARPKDLPVLFDILGRAASRAGPDDAVVVTNADICVQPWFYAAVRELLAAGFDALVINRRTIAAAHAWAPGSTLDQAEPGVTHPGFDCFVMRRRLADHFVPSAALVGVPGVALGLIYNMIARAERMLILRNADLTRHFGDDRSWRDPALEDYARFNREETRKVWTALGRDPAVRARLEAYARRTQQRDPREG